VNFNTHSPHSKKPPIRTSLAHLHPTHLRGHLHFIGQYIRNPKQIGAIAPSSEWLAKAMTEAEWVDDAQTVVELGPGLGSVTAAIQERMSRNGGLFFALEINESMCDRLRHRFPGARVYCDSATELRKYLDQHGRTHADCIISSIPWAALEENLQHELMAAILANLRPGGWFITFMYVTSMMLPASKRFRERLEKNFGDVTASPVIWRNIPPAFVFRCRKTN
jgi:phosphatidylethanolamine/phosphatidyl-N-methylethanolamine N-methyltransferase